MGALEPGTPGYNEQIFVNMTREDSGSQKEVMIRSRKNSRRRQQEQVSKLMIFSLVAMIAGFIMATPLSLVLTIPAYILADKAEVMKREKSDMASQRYRCYKYWSILLSSATIVMGLATILVIIAVYIYIVYPKMHHS